MGQKKLQNILLVEDEEDIQVIAQIALEDIGGFSVEYCSSGKCALEKASYLDLDLILLDVMMPEMDGITTYRELRKLPKTKETPIIFMTAKVQASEIELYFSLGALDVVAKPFDPLSLAKDLQTIWSAHEEQ